MNETTGATVEATKRQEQPFESRTGRRIHASNPNASLTLRR